MGSSTGGHMRWDDGSYYIGAMRKGQHMDLANSTFAMEGFSKGRSFLPP